MRSSVRVEAARRRHLDGIAAAEVEAALVERAGDDATVEAAEGERGAHVRAAVLDGDDPLTGDVGEEDVEVAAANPSESTRWQVGDRQEGLEVPASSGSGEVGRVGEGSGGHPAMMPEFARPVVLCPAESALPSLRCLATGPPRRPRRGWRRGRGRSAPSS